MSSALALFLCWHLMTKGMTTETQPTHTLAPDTALTVHFMENEHSMTTVAPRERILLNNLNKVQPLSTGKLHLFSKTCFFGFDALFWGGKPALIK
ncbi:hypothetical protein [Pseudomonas viridiflava]|uniref:hypothetical protein n=1 Tax=Pseudomonas viridiflava TaxID=33069 RepID=UPI002A69C6C4|nr:hypothetical protein [Pseudomonas viridiflava]MDY0937704.1 hypothetical protein [Pseudomonas viridiflava]MDY1012700.1 hypothetical protein [Pseudomonas viridiflava]